MRSFLTFCALALAYAVAAPPASGIGSAISAEPARAFGGRIVQLRFTVHTATSQTSTPLAFALTSNDVAIAKGKLVVPLTNGNGEVNAEVPLPAVKRPVRALLTFTGASRNATQPLWIFPPPIETAGPALMSPGVVFVEAPDAVRQLADETKGRARFFGALEAPPADWRLAVVNANSDSIDATALAQVWTRAATAEKKQSLIFIGRHAGTLASLTTVEGSTARVDAEGTDHPLLREISADWLLGWNRARGWPMPVGNFVAPVLWHLPAAPQLLAPLLEIPRGEARSGWSLFCSLPLLDTLRDDPAAGSLLTALVRHAAGLAEQPAPIRQTVVLAETDSVLATALAKITRGIAIEASALRTGATVLVETTAANAEILHRAIGSNQKPRIVLINLKPDTFAAFERLLPVEATLKPGDKYLSLEVERGPLTTGLTAAWLRLAVGEEMLYRLLVPTETKSRSLVGGGLVVAWEHRGVEVIAWQLPVRSEAGRAALCQFLTNAGARLQPLSASGQ